VTAAARPRGEGLEMTMTTIYGGARGVRVVLPRTEQGLQVARELAATERAERFAAGGVEVARRGGLHPHEVMGYALREAVPPALDQREEDWRRRAIRFGY